MPCFSGSLDAGCLAGLVSLGLRRQSRRPAKAAQEAEPLVETTVSDPADLERLADDLADVVLKDCCCGSGCPAAARPALAEPPDVDGKVLLQRFGTCLDLASTQGKELLCAAPEDCDAAPSAMRPVRTRVTWSPEVRHPNAPDAEEQEVCDLDTGKVVLERFGTCLDLGGAGESHGDLHSCLSHSSASLCRYRTGLSMACSSADEDEHDGFHKEPLLRYGTCRGTWRSGADGDEADEDADGRGSPAALVRSWRRYCAEQLVVLARQPNASCARGVSLAILAFQESKRHTHSPRALLRLVATHPFLVSRSTLAHPAKLLTVLHHAHVGKLDRFCSAVPKDILSSALEAFFRALSAQTLRDVVVPLINDERLHGPVAEFLGKVPLDKVTKVLSEIGPNKLHVIFRAPASHVAELVNNVEFGNLSAMLEPVRHNVELITGLLMHTANTEHMAAVVNHVKAEVVVWLSEDVSALRIAQIINTFPDEHFAADGCFINFLRLLEGERRLTRTKVAPFLQLIHPMVVSQLIRMVPPENLLQVLAGVGAPGVARILENTNNDFIIKLWNSPLECLVTHGANPLAHMQTNGHTAHAIKSVTDVLQSGIRHVEIFARSKGA